MHRAALDGLVDRPLQAQVLGETSPVLAELVKQKKLAIRAAMYDVGNGKVTMIEA